MRQTRAARGLCAVALLWAGCSSEGDKNEPAVTPCSACEGGSGKGGSGGFDGSVGSDSNLGGTGGTSNKDAASGRPLFCGDLGESFSFGLSLFSSGGNWMATAKQQYGVDWRFGYFYTLPNSGANPDYYTYFVKPRTESALAAGATPVYTFYQLLKLGQDAGFTGSHEADIVKQTLADPALMKQYFVNFEELLKYTSGLTSKAIVHVEPDSFGFMMWAWGTEGLDDPATVVAKVGSSGYADAAGLPDNAIGLARALLAIRDKAAPTFRMAIHVSNFRAGTRPEVPVKFVGALGNWDVVFCENPHVETSDATWWEPWEEQKIQTNLTWFKTVAEGLRLPIVLWQTPIGSTDFHLLGNNNDLTILTRFAQAGVVSVLFEHQSFKGETDPDLFRASGDFGTVPPASSAAGGTAKDLRDRLARYAKSPLPWPEGNLCR